MMCFQGRYTILSSSRGFGNVYPQYLSPHWHPESVSWGFVALGTCWEEIRLEIKIWKAPIHTLIRNLLLNQSPQSILQQEKGPNQDSRRDPSFCRLSRDPHMTPNLLVQHSSETLPVEPGWSRIMVHLPPMGPRGRLWGGNTIILLAIPVNDQRRPRGVHQQMSFGVSGAGRKSDKEWP